MIKQIFFVTFILLIQPVISTAHHNAMSVYDVRKTISVEGKVVNLRLVSPHMRLYINVLNDEGEEEQWMVDGPGKHVLAQRGWTDDMFKSGEYIKVIGKPTHSGNKAILYDRIFRQNGSELIEPALEDELAIEEELRQRRAR
jgi:DNA/RNA endonuclease YhcR with UshA esterase domain